MPIIGVLYEQPEFAHEFPQANLSLIHFIKSLWVDVHMRNATYFCVPAFINHIKLNDSWNTSLIFP